ncbi:MAG: hypothetical protein ACREKS_06245 [Candidatus Rokuibacteriota bacterium]
MGKRTLLGAQGGQVEVLWLGQAAFRITTPTGKVIVTTNPTCCSSPSGAIS